MAINDNNELLDEIIDRAVDSDEDYDENIFLDIEDDVYRDVSKLFDKLLVSGKVLPLEKKKELLNKMLNVNSSFFDDEMNILFLKLLNIYNKNLQAKGKAKDQTFNQDLYYIVDYFYPSSTVVSAISKQLQEELSKTKLEVSVDYDSILTPYIEARNQAKARMSELTDDDDELTDDDERTDSEVLAAVINILDRVIDYDYLEVLFDNNKGWFEDLISKADINMLAKIYCEVHGNGFTQEEKQILFNELSETEMAILSATISGKKRK